MFNPTQMRNYTRCRSIVAEAKPRVEALEEIAKVAPQFSELAAKLRTMLDYADHVSTVALHVAKQMEQK